MLLALIFHTTLWWLRAILSFSTRHTLHNKYLNKEVYAKLRAEDDAQDNKYG